MNQPNNGHQLSMAQDARPRYTGERLLRERPKIYRQVGRLLGEGRVSEQDLWSEGKYRQIARAVIENHANAGEFNALVIFLGSPRHPQYKQLVMEKISVAFAGLAVIIAMTILQGCVGTARTAGTQCAKPTLIPSDATHATTTVTVRIATKTAGAYLRYTLDGSTPTGGSSGNGTQIAAASGKVSFTVGSREKTLKAIAYKPGLADSPIAEGIYVYESPYR